MKIIISNVFWKYFERRRFEKMHPGIDDKFGGESKKQGGRVPGLMHKRMELMQVGNLRGLFSARTEFIEFH